VLKFVKYPYCCLGKKICMDLGIDKDLMEFTKIPMPQFLRILTGFNEKSERRSEVEKN
jgi:hypothetical protein